MADAPVFEQTHLYCFEDDETWEESDPGEDVCIYDEGHATRPEMHVEKPVFSEDGSDERDRDYYHHGHKMYEYTEDPFADEKPHVGGGPKNG